MKIKSSNRLNAVQNYYFAAKLSEIKQRQQQGQDIINLGIGNPDLPVQEEVTDALAMAAKQKGSNYYQPYAGIDDLRKAMSRWYAESYKVHLQYKNEILPLAGSKEGITLVSLAFINPGDTVLVPNPGYPAYESAAKLAGARVLKYNLLPENSWLPDFEELELLAARRARLIWINYPHMPTGTEASSALFQKFVSWGIKHNILVVNDNPYSHILTQTKCSIFNTPQSHETCLELNSLSKSHRMQGFRVGMAVGHSDLISPIQKVKNTMDSGMYLPIQKAAITALAMGAKWYKKTNKVYQARKAIICKALKALDCTFDENAAGMFVWARISNNFKSGADFSDFLLNEMGVFVAPGEIFGSNGNNYIRASLCVANKQLEKINKRVEKQIIKIW